jgi:hypothetical protein
MDTEEYNRLNDAAFAEMDAIMKKMESGVLSVAEGERLAVQALEEVQRKTAGYRTHRDAEVRRKVFATKAIPFILLAAALAFLAWSVLS